MTEDGMERKESEEEEAKLMFIYPRAPLNSLFWG